MLKHPLFRKKETASGVWWEESVYYYWWEFLRRHEGYKRTCEMKGKGIYAKLYEHFGNVHATDFKTWWSKGERGARLFAEPPTLRDVEKLDRDQIASLIDSDWDESSAIVVSVPLQFSRRLIQQRFAEVLDKYHKRGRGQQVHRASRALYPIAHNLNLHSLKTALRAYDRRVLEPNLKFWQIAQKESLSETLTVEELKRGRGDITRIIKQKAMASAAFRKLQQAKKLIDGVGKGIFPAV